MIDPATLVQNYGQPGPAAPVTITEAGATRSEAPPPASPSPLTAPGGPAAYVPPVPVAGGPGGYLPPTVTGAAAGNGAAPPAAAPGPSTRPMGQQWPLPEDLGDVLTPVSYARRPVALPGAGTGIEPAPGAGARPVAVPEPPARARWHPVLVVVAASVSVILPVAGTVAALLAFAGLRTAGLVQRRTTARRSARGARAMDPVVTVVSLPWFFLRSLFALLLLAPFALAAAALAAGLAVVAVPGAWPDRALAYGAGALVLFYGFGPGSRVPRTQLRRIFGTFTKTPAARIVVVLGVVALALAAVSAAVSSPSVFWPTIVPGNVVQFGVAHLGPLRRLAYLAHLSGPHRFGVLHGRFLPGRFLSHLK